jgi:CRISPR/Cas system-associated protein endoribonuclease Cas2
MPSQTVVLQMDAYHDMVAEVSALKSQVERLQGLQQHDANEIRTLRVANKDFFQQLQEALHDNVRLHKELRLARQQPRMFKTVKVG